MIIARNFCSKFDDLHVASIAKSSKNGISLRRAVPEIVSEQYFLMQAFIVYELNPETRINYTTDNAARGQNLK